MTRTLIRVGLALLGNALGLIIAAIILPKMTLSGAAFFVAVVIFTVLTAVIEPLVSKLAADRSSLLESASALVATFVALVLTALISDGLNLDGIIVWVLATAIIWLATLIIGVILAKLFLKDVAKAK
jgi:uncharacterized membrane protein YvlD (DUF360 family)